MMRNGSGVKPNAPTNDQIAAGVIALSTIVAYQRKWMTGSNLFKLLKHHYMPILNLEDYGLNAMNGFLAGNKGSHKTKYSIDTVKNNPIGVFRRRSKMAVAWHPNGNVKSTRNIWHFYLMEKDESVGEGLGKPFKVEEVKPITLNRKSVLTHTHLSELEVSEPPAKIQRLDSIKDSRRLQIMKELQGQTFFDSGMARNVFVNDQTAENFTVVEVIEQRITLLKESKKSPEGWRILISDGDAQNVMTPKDIYSIQVKSMYLISALQLALDKMKHLSWTWEQCCEEAIERVNFWGYELATSAVSVMRTHQVFKNNSNKFPNPKPKAASGMKALPKLFELYPEAKARFIQHADNNLNGLHPQFMTVFVNSKLIPDLLIKHNTEKLNIGEDVKSKEEFLRGMGFLSNRKHDRAVISEPTVLRWMILFGYKWCSKSKHYIKDKKYQEAFYV